MTVRSHLAYLKEWIDDRLADIDSGKTPNPEKTFAWYWIKNAGDGEYFAHKDVVFECFHNFVALSQWGNTLYNIMLKLAKDTGDPDAQAWFKKTMEGNPDDAAGNAFTPLERFVMELFRTISPNGGSISALDGERGPPPFERHGYIVSPHTSTSLDPVHWKNPKKFNPDRYNTAPTSHEIDEANASRSALPNARSTARAFDVTDGRKAAIHNSGFGTVYGIVDGKPLPVCDYAGLCAVRLRLSPLPRRAAHHPGLRGFPAQGVEGQDRVRKARHRQPRTAADRTDHGHRRQCRLYASGLVERRMRPGGATNCRRPALSRYQSLMFPRQAYGLRATAFVRPTSGH